MLRRLPGVQWLILFFPLFLATFMVRFWPQPAFQGWLAASWYNSTTVIVQHLSNDFAHMLCNNPSPMPRPLLLS